MEFHAAKLSIYKTHGQKVLGKISIMHNCAISAAEVAMNEGKSFVQEKDDGSSILFSRESYFED